MKAVPLLGLLAGPALLAQAQPTFYAAYQDGLDAERRGDWTAASAAYRRAIELRPAPAGRVVIYGNNLLLHYYPYTRRARCELELGHRDAAGALLAQAAAKEEPALERESLLRHLEETAARPVPSPAPATAGAATEGQAPPRPAPAAGPAPAPSAPPPAAGTQPPVPAPAPPQAVPGSEPRPEPATARPEPPPEARATPAPASTALPAPAPSIASAPAPSGHPWRIALLLAGGVALLAGAAWAVLRPRGKNGDHGFRDPDRIGPYRIERLLGRGGFASTYLARHEAKGTPVALKVLHPYRQDDPEFLSRFRQEARLGSRLDHPCIVRLLDPGPEEGTPYLAMEYVSGRRLDQALREDGPPALPDLLRLAREIADGMAYAHVHGVVHRDLKPGNIMLAGDRIKIMDFGISRVVDSETLTTTYAFLGTPLYAAPEAQTKTQVGPAADRYSFGVLLFELITGHPPFTGETPFEILSLHRSAPPPDLGTLRPEVPRALARLVARLLDKEPDQRPEDGEILRVLAELAALTPPQAVTPQG
ncbi:MAG TPA: protein kinase [Holophagaceae bacterium]